MHELEIGHVINRLGGRERVFVLIRCAHGPDDAPKEYITEHSEYERIGIEQRGSVIDEAVLKHRANVFTEHGVTCDCPMPAAFSVYTPYLAAGRS